MLFDLTPILKQLLEKYILISLLSIFNHEEFFFLVAWIVNYSDISV